jgi:hypothetical protein
MLVFVAALVGLVIGGDLANRILLVALVPLSIVALVGHFVAIMASKRVRS